MLTVLISAKGSPGVTTTAVVLAAAASKGATSKAMTPALVVEADEAGGDLECWSGPHGESGLVRAAVGPRFNGSLDDWRAGGVVVDAVPGVPAVIAPTTAAATAAAAASATAWLPDVAGILGSVWVDAGRASVRHLDHGLLDIASVVLVVCRPILTSLEHARELTAALGLHRRVGLIVVGEAGPYGAEEIAAALPVPVVGALPWDPRGVGTLVEQGVSKAWYRTRLATAGHGIVEALAQADGSSIGGRHG